MTIFQILAVLLTLTAAGGYINACYLRLPPSIGLMVFALLLSLAGIVVDALGWIDLTPFGVFVDSLDFTSILLHGMLSVLLFAGALHINWNDLRQVGVPVAALATVGTAIAALVTGTLVWALANWLGLALPYLYALLFGALIAPTDPIAVLGILKRSAVSPQFYTKIGGESLFNDGVGIVMFLTVLGVIGTSAPVSGMAIALDLLREVAGGLALGGTLGWLTYRILKPVNDYSVEVTSTLALALGGYVLAEILHISAPITVVTAGLVIGNQGRGHGMSAATRQRLDMFWELLDEILNAVLFMLIGLELLVVTLHGPHLVLGLGAVAAVLLGRWISVLLPVTALRTRFAFEAGTIRLMTWGGLRGGISIALALSLPHSAEKTVLVPVTYVVVLFSILVQGLTFKKLLVHIVRRQHKAQIAPSNPQA